VAEQGVQARLIIGRGRLDPALAVRIALSM
jgi:hypothetical protein